MSLLQLGDLIELKYGKSLRKDTRNEGSVPVFGSNGQVDVHSESLVNHPTIIVGRKGSIGEVHLIKTPCWPIDTTYFVESLGKHEFDLEWLYRLLQSLRLQELNRSAAIPGLNRDDVYRIPVLLPSLNDQIRIVHLLGKVEGLITNRKKHLQQLDDLLKSVFLEMFGDPAFNPYQWDEITFKDAIEYIGDIGSNGSNAVVTKNLQMSDQEDYALMVRTVNLSSNNFTDNVRYVSKETYNFFKKSKVFGGELIMNKIGSAGLFWIMPNLERPVSLGLNQLLIRIKKEIPIAFIYHFYSTQFGKIKILNSLRGATTKSITKTAVNELPLLFPPENLQNKFANIAEKIEGIKSRYQQSLTDLETLYSALSQQAFKGELDLSRIEPLTQQIIQCSMEEQSLMPTPNIVEIPAIELPETDFLISALNSRDNLQQLLRYWLEAYIAQLGETAFSVERFIATAQTRLAERHPDNDFELGADAYEHIKSWVFEALSAGKLTQVFDEVDNSIHLKAM